MFLASFNETNYFLTKEYNISRLYRNTESVLTKVCFPKTDFLSKQKINRIFQCSVLCNLLPVFGAVNISMQ